MAAPFALAFYVTFDEAIAAAKARGVVLPDEFYGDLQEAARTGAFTISNIESVSVLQDILDSLTLALEDGQTFAEWQDAVSPQLDGLTSARQELVFRNAVQTSYSIGHTVRQRENVGTRPYLMWDAINDSRTRPTHHAMDGYIAPVNDPIWHHWSPPAGFNCRCSRISLTEDQARARGYPMHPPGVAPDPGFDYEKADAVTDNLDMLLRQRTAEAPAAIRDAVANRKQEPDD